MRHIIPLLLAVSALLAQAPDEGAEPRPRFPPSYEVHISPTTRNAPGTSETNTREYSIGRGFELSDLILEAYHVDERRLILPASLKDRKRYDFALVPPQPVDDAARDRLIQKAIESYFHVTIVHESQPLDVYVMRAPNGKSEAIKDISATYSNPGIQGFGVVMSDTEISAQGTTMSAFAQSIQSVVENIVIDETDLHGQYDFNVRGSSSVPFLEMLNQKLGLVLTREHRDVDMLVVRPN